MIAFFVDKVQTPWARLFADQLIELIAVFRFSIHTYKAGYSLTAAENEDSGDGRDAQSTSDITGDVRIELGNHGLAFKLYSQFLNDWSQHAAWAAPWGPEIDEHRLVAFKNGTIPVATVDFESTSSHFQFTLSQ